MLPNFLIIGAAKSGTTSLYHYLRQHPEIYMSPVKEPNYFALAGRPINFHGPGDMDYIGSFSITNRSDYEALFDAAGDANAIGEASPFYLYSARAASNIENNLPNAKLICILRNPVERAYSHYLMFRRDHREPVSSFETALSLEDKRKSRGWEWAWFYKDVGRYGEQIKRYQFAFNHGNIKVFLYEDLLSDLRGCIRELFRFLGVKTSVNINLSKRHNVTTIPRSAQLNSLLNSRFSRKLVSPLVPKGLARPVRQKVQKWNLARPPIRKATRELLVSYFRDDILLLQDLIQRDLSPWLDPKR